MKQLLIMIIKFLGSIINHNSNIIINKNPYNAPRNGIITLYENDPSASLQQVNLIGFDPSQTYAFKLDVQGQRISEYLNPTEPKINSACDGIIFTLIDEIYYTFFCEMKSSKPNIKDCITKYRNSTLFINYIFSMIQEFYPVPPEFSFDEIQYRYILFDLKRSAEKTLTSGKGNKVSPTRFRSDDGRDILLYQIHHLHQQLELFNIRHLNLDITLS